MDRWGTIEAPAYTEQLVVAVCTNQHKPQARPRNLAGSVTTCSQLHPTPATLLVLGARTAALPCQHRIHNCSAAEHLCVFVCVLCLLLLLLQGQHVQQLLHGSAGQEGQLKCMSAAAVLHIMHCKTTCCVQLHPLLSCRLRGEQLLLCDQPGPARVLWLCAESLCECLSCVSWCVCIVRECCMHLLAATCHPGAAAADAGPCTPAEYCLARGMCVVCAPAPAACVRSGVREWKLLLFSTAAEDAATYVCNPVLLWRPCCR